MLKELISHKLIFVGVLIQISFFISAIWTNWYDYFFFGSSIHHCCKGLDFYQIPNAVYALFNGGDLTGKLPPGIIQYSQDHFSNLNVYHPLITVGLGSIFLLINPDSAFYLWMLVKLFINLLLAIYIYKNFKTNKYVDFSIFIFLICFSQYNEIVISQYQFLFNSFLLLFLINLIKNKNNKITGFFFFLTLIAKPIGILWAPAFIIKRQLKIFSIGFGLFLLSTGIFLLLGNGFYYTNNLISHFLHPIPTNTIDIMSLDALMRQTFNFSINDIKIIKYISFIFIFALAFKKDVSLVKIIFLLIVYFLMFYDLIYQYHFSVLGPVLAICVLAIPEFQTKIARYFVLIINLPTIFFLLRFFKIGFYNNTFLGPDPTLLGWQIVSFSQILPILLLVTIVLIPDIKKSVKKVK